MTLKHRRLKGANKKNTNFVYNIANLFEDKHWRSNIVNWTSVKQVKVIWRFEAKNKLLNVA